jgi:rare lipoprotein A
MRLISPRNWQNAIRLVVLAAFVAPMLAACGSGGNLGAKVKRSAFTSKEYGVAVSPRVTRNPNPPKGGGRYLVGKPYTVRGQVYTPQENPQGYADVGQASWYGSDFHGRRTANGEIFSANAITGAHPTLPLPSYVRVTNTDNGRSVVVRVNDRGPYIHGRIMDLSYKAAEILGYVNKGTGNIAVNYIGPAPLNGDDTRMLVASINKPTRMEQQLGAGMGDVRLAMVEPQQAQPALEPFPSEQILDGNTVAVSNGRINFADYQNQQGSRGSYSSDDLAEDFFGLFGYAATEEEAAINSAHAAANAMATRSTALESWVAAVDEDARDIKLQVGQFRDGIRAIEVAEAFAVLGAVDEEQVVLGDHTETRLTLTKLKPGVARADVLSLAQELGLSDIVLY